MDKLLRDELKEEYTAKDTGTATAGDLVAKIMQAAGYKNGGVQSCGPDCVAKTAILWVPPKRA